MRNKLFLGAMLPSCPELAHLTFPYNPECFVLYRDEGKISCYFQLRSEQVRTCESDYF